MFAKSDFFSVKEIRIEGLDNIDENEVFKLMGTVKGENIFLTDTNVLAQKIKIHPLVEQVKVEKKMPSILALKIQERLPVAFILNNDNVVEVDSQGIILRFYETWPKQDCPVITGIEIPEAVGPGQRITSAHLNKALLLIGQAPEGLPSMIDEVNAATDGKIFLYLSTGVQVKIGYGDEFAGKLQLLKELLDSTEYKTVEKAIKYIDLSAGKPVLGR